MIEVLKGTKKIISGSGPIQVRAVIRAPLSWLSANNELAGDGFGQVAQLQLPGRWASALRLEI